MKIYERNNQNETVRGPFNELRPLAIKSAKTKKLVCLIVNDTSGKTHVITSENDTLTWVEGGKAIQHTIHFVDGNPLNVIQRIASDDTAHLVRSL